MILNVCLCLQNEWNNATCSNTNGPKDDHTEVEQVPVLGLTWSDTSLLLRPVALTHWAHGVLVMLNPYISLAAPCWYMPLYLCSLCYPSLEYPSQPRLLGDHLSNTHGTFPKSFHRWSLSFLQFYPTILCTEPHQEHHLHNLTALACIYNSLLILDPPFL